MRGVVAFGAFALGLTAGPLAALEPGVPPVPPMVTGLVGCWQGEGDVGGKPIWISLRVYPVADGGFVAIDSLSIANSDPNDRYQTHLLFGGSGTDDGRGITAFWSDSFGGAYSATGAGLVVDGGFVVTYRYSERTFMNEWLVGDGSLTWTVTVRGPDGHETSFARNQLRPVPCD